LEFICVYNVHDQACSHVFRFGAQNTFSGVENFCFYNVFKTNLFGHKKTWGSLLPNATVTTGLYMTTQQHNSFSCYLEGGGQSSCAPYLRPCLWPIACCCGGHQAGYRCRS